MKPKLDVCEKCKHFSKAYPKQVFALPGRTPKPYRYDCMLPLGDEPEITLDFSFDGPSKPKGVVICTIPREQPDFGTFKVPDKCPYSLEHGDTGILWAAE
jgi:hypothetical protein